MKIDPSLLPLVGEFAWHSVTVDPRISEMSREHYQLVRQVMEDSFPGRLLADMTVLEVACYAHTSGYDLARELQCDVTLFELSAATLRLGRSLARPGETAPRLVIGDFHELPFADGVFDFVYICSALHHTWNFQQVARELMRVVRPGGILFIENEPCLREACFYRFRCNREGDFTNLEKHLWTEGWLRTFGEPYVGSRPETLFGMIENQKMSLPDLLAVFRESGAIEKVDVFPEICMGPRERSWFDARGDGAGALAARIERDILGALHAARNFVGPVERGLGWELPEDEDVPAVAARTATHLCSLSGNPVEPEFRCRLAEAFGGSVRLTIRRQGAGPTNRAEVAVRTTVVEPDGILNGFPLKAQKLLGQNSRLPSLQEDSPSIVAQAFPTAEWTSSRSAQDVIGLSPRNPLAHIHTIPDNKESLLILRLYCGIGQEGPYEVRLSIGCTHLAAIQVYHAESRLVLAHLPPDTSGVVMEIGVIGSDVLIKTMPPMTIAYAGLFATPLNVETPTIRK
jgi:ubiquinone/menaquinone biosynthesis C-methylase UbiE